MARQVSYFYIPIKNSWREEFDGAIEEYKVPLGITSSFDLSKLDDVDVTKPLKMNGMAMGDRRVADITLNVKAACAEVGIKKGVLVVVPVFLDAVENLKNVLSMVFDKKEYKTTGVVAVSFRR